MGPSRRPQQVGKLLVQAMGRWTSSERDEESDSEDESDEDEDEGKKHIMQKGVATHIGPVKPSNWMTEDYWRVLLRALAKDPGTPDDEKRERVTGLLASWHPDKSRHEPSLAARVHKIIHEQVNAILKEGGTTQGPKDHKAELEAVKQNGVGSQKGSEDLRRKMKEGGATQGPKDHKAELEAVKQNGVGSQKDSELSLIHI